MKAGRKVSTAGGPPPSRLLPPILIDPRTFFSQPGPARMMAVFEACNVTLSQETMVGQINQAASRVFPVKPRQATQALAVEKLRKSWRLNSTLAPHRIMRAFIDELKDWLREAKRETEQAKAETKSVAWEGEVPPDVSLDLARAQEVLAAAVKELDQLVSIRKQAEAQRQTNAGNAGIITRLEQEIRLNEWDVAPPEPDRSHIEQLSHVLSEAQASNSRNSERRSSIQKRLDAVALGKCPTCGCSGTGLDVLRGTLESELGMIPAAVDTAAMRARLDVANRDYQKQVADRERYLASLSQIEGLRRQIEQMRRVTAEPQDVTDDQISEAQAARDRGVKAVNMILAESAKWEAYQQVDARRLALEQALDTKVAVQLTLEDILAVMVEVMDRAIEQSISRVIRDTHDFTDGLLNSRLEYDEELGRRVSEADRGCGCQAAIGSWISHESFSGTEEALAYAAFSVAMAMTASFRVVIMDELGRVDRSVRRKVLERMVSLVSQGKIDQFIGIDTTSSDVAGLTLIELGTNSY